MIAPKTTNYEDRVDYTKEVGLIEETKSLDKNSTQAAVKLPDRQVQIEDETTIDFGKRKYMFRFSDPILNKWDMFIILIAIYNCFTLSFNIGFDPSWASHPAYITLDFLLMVCYIIDIIQSFMTTYLDKDGEEI